MAVEKEDLHRLEQIIREEAQQTRADLMHIREVQVAQGVRLDHLEADQRDQWDEITKLRNGREKCPPPAAPPPLVMPRGKAAGVLTGTLLAVAAAAEALHQLGRWVMEVLRR